ncbi:MAG: ABC transporter ATP-binding protein [Candidatus Microsaccharimonas sp.]
MKDDIAIKLDHVSKSFKLPHESGNSLKSIIVNFWRRKKGYSIQHVLDNVSFEIKKGEFFGIVGRNGSGKSTLLKIISDIYKPDSGSVTINGKLTPFIELGVGFNPELTGRENTYLNGALLGFSNKEMDDMYNEIVEFAELEMFMDQKLKNYSSGMQVRLAFSVAIRARSDILVLDEVLAVGDEAFQKKCNDYFLNSKNDGKTIVLVTHDMGAVEKFCDRAVLISGGAVTVAGSVKKVVKEYHKLNT